MTIISFIKKEPLEHIMNINFLFIIGILILKPSILPAFIGYICLIASVLILCIRIYKYLKTFSTITQ